MRSSGFLYRAGVRSPRGGGVGVVRGLEGGGLSCLPRRASFLSCVLVIIKYITVLPRPGSASPRIKPLSAPLCAER